MPPAGQQQADRATAHYRWAERYTKRGNVGKAAAHFGRARQLEFGAVIDEKLERWHVMMDKYASFTVEHIPGNGVGTTAATFSRSQSKDNSARAYYETLTGAKTGTVNLVRHQANKADIDERLEDIYVMLRKYKTFEVEHYDPLVGATAGKFFDHDEFISDMNGHTKIYNGFLNETSGTVKLTSFEPLQAHSDEISSEQE